MMYYYYWQNYQISHVLKEKGESHPNCEDAVPKYRIPVTTSNSSNNT